MNPKTLKNAKDLLNQGAFGKAINLLAKDLQRHPDHGEAQLLLGTALSQIGQLGTALDHLQRACQLLGKTVRTLLPLATVVMRLGDTGRARELFRDVLALEPEHAGAHYYLGSIDLLHGALDQAEQHFITAGKAPQLRLAALAGQASVLEHRRDYTGVMDLLWPLFIRGERDLGILGILSDTCCHGDIDLQRVRILTEALEQLLLRGVPGWERLNPANRASPWFDLGGLYEKLKDYPKALDAYGRANACLPQTFDETAHERLCRNLTEQLRPLPATPPHVSTPRFLFIVGMPRSGSTLVDQILAAHPEVVSVGESGFFVQSLRRLKGDNWMDSAVLTATLSDRDAGQLRQLYLEQCPEPAQSARLIVDKTLDNAYCSRLLLQAFPDALVLHMRRNPMDTCLSCFRVNFMETFAFTTDLSVLGRYYLRFDALLQRMATLFAGRMFRLDYEELVGNFEDEVRQLLARCQLDFRPECLAFHQSERLASTASYHQVSQPLYTSAVGRWKKYGDGVKPLLEALGMVDVETLNR